MESRIGDQARFRVPNEYDLSTSWTCVLIRLGDHVVVRGEDEEAVVTAVHPDSQIEVEFLHSSEGGPRRRRYSAEALEQVSR
jgi:hypothetical protein